MSPHHGMSPLDKNIVNLTTSSPTLSVNNSPITPHSGCLGNASPSMTLCASASICAWTVLHKGSLGRSRLLTLTMRTWRNSSTTWNGTCAQRVSSTHSTKAVALQSPIPLYMNKASRFSDPYPTNGNNKVNTLDLQQRQSTFASKRKPLPSICSSSKMIGLPPRPSTTYREDSISPNPKTLSGGKYSDKTTLYTTKSLTSKDTRTRMKDSTLDTWKHPPKKGMNVASGHHFSILPLSLASHHLTNYLNYYLTHAPDLVPHDWGARDCSHDPVTDYLLLTLDFSCDQACDLSCDTM